EACSCPPEPTPTEAKAMRLVGAIFEGTIVNKRVVLARDEDVRYPAVEYEIAVSKVWKGSIGPKVRLFRPCVCDVYYQAGQTYLIYAASHDNRLLTLGCITTKTSTEAVSDMIELGTPIAVFTPPATAGSVSRPFLC